MLTLAAAETPDAKEVLELVAVSFACAQEYELGKQASAKQRNGLQACTEPVLRREYAKLVRKGEIADAQTGLSLHRSKERRRTGYLAFMMFVGWTWLVLAQMAVNGALDAFALIVHMIGALIMSWWLTKGLFASVRSDEKTVAKVNSVLRIRPVASGASQHPQDSAPP